MANDLNKHMCIGRLGQDPEVRYTQDGKAVATLSVACGESWKDKQTGQKQERTEWIRYVAFGNLAEIIGKYLTKGSKVYLSGKLTTRKWQDNNGQDRYTTEIVANEMQMLDSRTESAGGAGGNQPSATRDAGHVAGTPAQQNSPEMDGFDDDLPF